MNFKFAARLLALAGLASLTSCVDDGYDLSDVDSTSRFTVEDLVVPINIDELTLKDVISFDDDSKIQPVTIDGKNFLCANSGRRLFFRSYFDCSYPRRRSAYQFGVGRAGYHRRCV